MSELSHVPLDSSKGESPPVPEDTVTTSVTPVPTAPLESGAKQVNTTQSATSNAANRDGNGSPLPSTPATPARSTQNRAPRVTASCPRATGSSASQRKSLSDILQAGNGDTLRNAWEATEPAAEFTPLPAGEYVAHAACLELFNSRERNTPGVKLKFRVVEGEHFGRFVSLDLWLTEAALPMAKRDLAKLGVMSLDQLERPLPRGIRCEVRVALRTEDDGTQFNRVRSFQVIHIDEPRRDPFAPRGDEASEAEFDDAPSTPSDE